VTYLEDTDSLELYTTSWGPVSPAITPSDLPAGSVLQVVSTSKTDNFTSSSGTFTNVTGLAATITPGSPDSRVSVLFTVSYSSTTDGFWQFRVTRNGTPVNVGDEAGVRTRVSFGSYSAGANNISLPSNVIAFVDSPATTSAVTYALQARTDGLGTGFINRNATDANTTQRMSGSSDVILMEVAG